MSDNPFFNDPSVTQASQGVSGSIAVVSPVLAPSPVVVSTSPAPAQPTRAVEAVSVALPEVPADPEESEEAKSNFVVDATGPNYPPIPLWLRCGHFKPCYRVHITEDIPLYAQITVSHALRLSQLIALAWFWNFVCALIALSCSSCTRIVPTVILAGIFFVLFGTGSFLCWFNPLYVALKKDSSVRFGWFFFTSGFQMLFCLLFGIGIPGVGGAGFWLAADVMQENVVAGLFIITSGLVWLAVGVAVFLLAKRVLHIYRHTTGETGRDAGDEMDAEIMGNASLQNVAKSAFVKFFSN